MNLPLKGLRVLDCSAVISGPFAAALLADQGAEVLRIESPEGCTLRNIGPAKQRTAALFMAVNRGKRILPLDMKKPAGAALVRSMALQADVLLENMRPGAMARLGLGPRELMQANPRLVYASITGFGPDGPSADERAYDGVIQARAGVCATHPEPATGQPTLLPSYVCDKLTAYTMAQAITAALLARSRTGRGQHVQVAMLDAVLAFQWPDAMYNQTFLDDAPQGVNEAGQGTRPWATRDGHIVMSTPQPSEFHGLCQVVGRPELEQDPRFSTVAARLRHVPEMRALMEPLLAQWDTAPLLQALRAAGVPAGKVNTRQSLLTDPQVLHNQGLHEQRHARLGRVRLARSAPRFGGDLCLPGAVPGPIGEETLAILRDMRLPQAQIDALVADGVVRVG